METYRNKLKIQNIFSLIGILVLALLIAIVHFYLPQKGYVLPSTEAHGNSFWRGFIDGVSAGFAVLLLLGVVRNLLAMGNEQKLRAQYIKAHDERTQRIWELSGASSYWFVTMGLLLAAIVAGYFNPLITIVIVCCIFYICIVRLILKIYYGKKL